MKQSFYVLSKDKELIIFPIISGVVSILLVISFILPFVFFEKFSESFAMLPFIFVFYLLSYFVVIFFNSALIGAAMIRLKGGDPTLRDGIEIAKNHILSILAWSLIAATVGIILNLLTQKAKDNFIARLIIGIVGGAWSLITFFVVPVLVVENVGPLEAISKSTKIVKEKFGETLLSQVGFGLFSLIGTLVLFVVGLGLTYILGTTIGLAGVVVGLVLLFAFIIGFSIVMSTLDSILVAALYHYASTGEVSEFDETLMQKLKEIKSE